MEHFLLLETGYILLQEDYDEIVIDEGWINKQDFDSAWSPKSRQTTPHYLAHQNSDNIELQDTDLLYTHEDGLDWGLKTRQIELTTLYLLFQNGDNVELQNGDLLYTHESASESWSLKPKISLI